MAKPLPLTLILSLALLSTTQAADPSDWSGWRGNGRDGMISSPLPESLDKSLELVWEKPHSPSYSGPIVHKGLVFTTETVDKRFERVTAYRIADGEEVWQTQWEGSMAVPFFAAANGDWIRSTPACSDAGLVVVGMRDVMVCLNPETGEQLWKVDFHKDMGDPLPMFGAACSPLIDGNKVYMQSGGATVCLSMANGSLIWKTLENGKSQSPGAFSSPTIATLQGKRQLLIQTRLAMNGVDLENGEVLWSRPITSFRGMNILTALPIGDRVFTSAHSGRAQMFNIGLNGTEWSAEEAWSQKQQAYMSSPVLVDGKIFMHLKNERMTMMDPETGEAIYTTSPVGKYASMVTDGSRVLALTNRGKLMLIDGTANEFKVLSEKQVAKDSWAHLAIAGENVVIRDLGALKVYKIKR